jgi:predicted YcjX-like family ATPase
MMNGGIAHPFALTASIAVTYFRFPGCFVLSLPFLSDDVITFKVEMIPI